jgi:hypothetical protein
LRSEREVIVVECYVRAVRVVSDERETPSI